MGMKNKLDRISVEADLFSSLSAAQKMADRLLVTIALQISDRRKALGLTQAKLAKKMAVSQPMVCQWESGDYNFSIETLAQIFDALEMKIDFTFSFKDQFRTNQSWDCEAVEKSGQGDFPVDFGVAA